MLPTDQNITKFSTCFRSSSLILVASVVTEEAVELDGNKGGEQLGNSRRFIITRWVSEQE